VTAIQTVAGLTLRSGQHQDLTDPALPLFKNYIVYILWRRQAGLRLARELEY
jgi:hypothetical protein